jgi:hypothetical protein
MADDLKSPRKHDRYEAAASSILLSRRDPEPP